MTEQELQAYLRAQYPVENDACEWKEFKHLKHAVSGQSGEDVVSYISAIANMDGGHLLLGVEDGTHRVVGIQDFHDYTIENIRPRLVGNCPNLDSENLRGEAFVTSDTGRTVWVVHVPKHKPRLPVYAHRKAWQRLGDSLIQMRQERLDAILNEPLEIVDWSAQLISGATVADLDGEALAKARGKFSEHFASAPFHSEIASWDDLTFLEKAKLAANGSLTRAALLLLGKASAAHHLSPNPAQITWKLEAEERAYEHYGPPFFLATTQLLQRIRNVKFKLFPRNQLLAVEVQKYDTRVILEALHNCIAHQDYTRNERVLVTEKVDRLIFENAGGFIEGKPLDYFPGNKTPGRYRNPWLSQAMVQLGMIDTMGYGIHTMATTQRQRFFPLPDYEKSTAEKVTLEIYGHSIDENYSLLLLERQDLGFDTVIMLDRVQKKLQIPDSAASELRRKKLIEGRKPAYIVSAHVAATTGTQAAYTRNIGLQKAKQKQFVLDHLAQFKTASREKLDELLTDMLPAGLTPAQKRNKITNLLTDMRARDRSIICEGKGPAARWRLV
jgi:ATP-dependent DNA helicase RecG